MSHVCASLCEYLRKFAGITSLRGVTRIFKADFQPLRVMWTLVVAASASIMIFSATQVINDFLKYDFSTSTKEDETALALFPDVTICNINSFGSINEQEWSEFFDNVTARKNQWPYERIKSVLTDMTKEEYDRIWEDMNDPTSYITSMDLQHVPKLLSQSMIVACKLSGEKDFDCSNDTQYAWDPFYQNCYTIHVPENLTKIVSGLSCVLFLNSLSPIKMNYFSANVDRSFATGAIVAIHAGGTLPDMKNAITVSPGVETTISVHQLRRIRLTQPWGACTNRQYLHDEDELDGKAKFHYTRSSCTDLCIQNKIIAKCGCMSASWTLTDVESRRANFTTCINHTSDNEETSSQWVFGSFKNMLCSLRVEDDLDACDCRLPCDEILYDVLLYVSGSWPHKSYQQAFYDTYLRETGYGDKIDKHSEDTNASKWTLIGDNFLQLNVVLKKDYPTIIQDKPVMSVHSLWSSIGGIMSLWLGMSIMFLFEIIELIVSVVRDRFCKNRVDLTVAEAKDGFRECRPTVKSA